MDRTILHCDCNGFYASVECLFHPEYKKVPMAVCGNPENRHGIILAKNELAKKYKIQTAETIWQAKRKCPELLLVPPHRDEYQRYSVIVNEIYQRYTDQVEPFGIDESWLDVTGSRMLFGEGREIADTLRETVKRETGLTISVGVSFNKIFAKLGSDYKKPDATTMIDRDNFREIVFPLPVNRLLYVGRSAQKVLERLRIRTIGELAHSDRRAVASQLGKIGEALHDYANGLDDSPVSPYYESREIKSIGNSLTFKRNLTGAEDIHLAVTALADTVASRMRKHNLRCQTVQVIIKNPSLKIISRQKTLNRPTYLSKVLADTALELIVAFWNLSAPIRMLSITGTNLTDRDTGEQLSLFGSSDTDILEKREHLEKTVDSIRGKFGREAVTLAGILNNDLGIDDPGGMPEENREEHPYG